MVSADQFLQCDVRLRQAKVQPNVRFGNVAMNICGDFLQLPPVDKHGTRKSLAVPVDEIGDVEAEVAPELEAGNLNVGDASEQTNPRVWPCA